VKRVDSDPDTLLLGRIVIVVCTALLGFLTFVPPPQGSPAGGRFYAMGFALLGLGWGLKQERAAREARKRLAAKADKGRTPGDS
jgi:hypothetical protein